MTFWRPFATGFVLWLCVSLLPYPMVGEYWGMVWILINYPATYLQSLTVMEWHYPFFFIAIATIVDALVFGFVCCAVAAIIGRKRGGNYHLEQPRSP